MVTKVYGKADGLDVVFTHVEGDKWKASVPPDLDGEYVVDLYAEDEAGNIGYTATVLFLIDARHLKFEIKLLTNFKAQERVIKYKAELQMRQFFFDITKCELCKSNYMVSIRMKDYCMSLLRCDVCGGEMYGQD